MHKIRNIFYVGLAVSCLIQYKFKISKLFKPKTYIER